MPSPFSPLNTAFSVVFFLSANKYKGTWFQPNQEVFLPKETSNAIIIADSSLPAERSSAWERKMS